jgi:hypothetical protein
VCSICLELVDGLQLVEPRPGPWQAQVCGLLHEAQLGLDVFLLLILAQCVPTTQLDPTLGIMFRWGEPTMPCVGPDWCTPPRQKTP